MSNRKHIVQQSLRMDIYLKYEIEEILLQKKKSGEQLTKSDLFLRYIKEGIERDKKKMKETEEEEV